MILILNAGIGLNTPPVGSVQFVACAIGKVSISESMRTIWPFYGASVAVLLLVTYVPAFSLWLPHSSSDDHGTAFPANLATCVLRSRVPQGPRPAGPRIVHLGLAPSPARISRPTRRKPMRGRHGLADRRRESPAARHA